MTCSNCADVAFQSKNVPPTPDNAVTTPTPAVETSTSNALVIPSVAIVATPVILIFLPVTSSYTKSPVTFKSPETLKSPEIVAAAPTSKSVATVQLDTLASELRITALLATGLPKSAGLSAITCV